MISDKTEGLSGTTSVLENRDSWLMYLYKARIASHGPSQSKDRLSYRDKDGDRRFRKAQSGKKALAPIKYGHHQKSREDEAMMYDIILSRQDDKYVARAKEWPEVEVTDNSRDGAIDQLKSQLLDYLTNKIEVIQVDIPLSGQTANPWVDKFGWFNDDPSFDDLQSEIASYRQELDQELSDLMK